MPEVPSAGLPSPPSSPPLAAIARGSGSGRGYRHLPILASQKRGGRGGSGHHNGGREGGAVTAALTIREECERFFCESLAAAFYGERNAVAPGSGLTGARTTTTRRSRDNKDNASGLVNGVYNPSSMEAFYGDAMLPNTPPDNDNDFAGGESDLVAGGGSGGRSFDSGVDLSADGLEPPRTTSSGRGGGGVRGEIAAWLEFWDYSGGTGFRGFVGRPRGQEESTLFLFFTQELVGMELKQAYVFLQSISCIPQRNWLWLSVLTFYPHLRVHSLMALIELADTALGCANITFCVDRAIAADEFHPLLKSLQWVGFEPTTLGAWGGGRSETSDRWFFMGMEV